VALPLAAAVATVAIAAGAFASTGGAAKPASPAGAKSKPARAQAAAPASTGRTSVEMRTGTGIVGSLRNGAPQKLAPGQAVAVAGSLATVEFARVIEDSRCPRGTTCVWAGRARVAMNVRISPSAPATAMELEVGSPEKGSVGIGDMRIVARALAPYPEAKVPIAAGDYRLELELADGDATARR
jgi:hypothetical protein